MTGEAVQLTPTSPRLWSPADPALYSVTATLETPEGSDVVGAYSGLRRIEARDGQLFLNGRRCYLRGVLDQGYWPRTGMTAPNDEALRADVELAAAAGFNLIRKHLKFENPRQLYWADRLGVLAWVEPPSVGRYSEDSMAAFMALLAPMAEIYGNHPSVILWGIFNEEWGLDWSTPQDPQRQRTVAAAYDRLRSADRSRPIIDNSGWAHVRTDVVDWHVYTDDPAYWSEVVSGLAGGRTDTLQIGIAPNRVVPRPLHLDPPVAPLPLLNSEYGVGLTGPERGWHMRWQTQMMRGADRLCGYVYCELYDIEHETAGVFTAARDPKDLGRTNPADVHAETVIVVELVPVAPGADIVIDADETATSVGFPVRISHHGSHALLGHLWWQWEHESLPAGSVELRADPFHCTDPIGITAKLTRQPGDTGAARLMLTVTDLDATMVARTFVDVRPTWVSGQSLIEH
jgi:hypothetical protein